MRMVGFLLLACLVTIAFPNKSRAANDTDGTSRCEALSNADFSGVPDAPTKVTGTRFVAGEGATPGYCKVHGYVAPSVGIVLLLPSEGWNGKLLTHGCGGYCGGNLQSPEVEKYGRLVGPLRRGYALMLFDAGHMIGTRHASEGPWVPSTLWGYNDLQRQFDFGIRGPHVATLAAKSIVTRFYAKPISKSYFSGCSTGGMQGLSLAQRFPLDFDGIVVGAPSPTFSGPMMYYVWNARALAGKVDSTQVKLLNEHALAQCDTDDGVKDGIIGDPMHCRVDPSQLLCKTSDTRACLTAVQVEAVKKVYAGPSTSEGRPLYTGAPLPGSELNWVNEDSMTAYVTKAGVPSPWPREYFAYLGFMPAPGREWQLDDFDFDRDPQRMALAESLLGAANNPDLRRFKAAGGKLILYQGLQDEADIPADAIDYYETTERTMGGRKVAQDFFRLFLIPGMNHCSGGPGATVIDYLSYLEGWSEQGKAPDRIVGAHLDNVNHGASRQIIFPLDASAPVRFTRPVYPYPIRAKYKGRGDTNDAASFAPVSP